MIVLDASILVELLTNGSLAQEIRDRLAALDESFAIPHLADIEVVRALRGLADASRIDSMRVADYLDLHATLPAERYSHVPLLERIWALRHNFTAYDAVYIALAEAMDATLYTTDEKLRRGHRARVVVVGP